jgi:hypothetical protein
MVCVCSLHRHVVQNNDITVLPLCLGELTSLTTLGFDPEEITSPPSESLDNTESVITWLRANYCPPGTGVVDGTDNTCYPCPEGTFNNVTSPLPCVACPAGSTAGVGASECQCPPGEGMDGGSCAVCLVGTFSNATMSACEACPAGLTSDTTRQFCKWPVDEESVAWLVQPESLLRVGESASVLLSVVDAVGADVSSSDIVLTATAPSGANQIVRVNHVWLLGYVSFWRVFCRFRSQSWRNLHLVLLISDQRVISYSLHHIFFF